MFQPFRTTKKGGFGIGLYQCKQILEQHHGKIWVESEVRSGTKVHVMLPSS
ncbi:MAG: ATP-binding protein [Nitrospirae bacterium]|nr:ATP-binding protein [Nitrospirota bacterium]